MVVRTLALTCEQRLRVAWERVVLARRQSRRFFLYSSEAMVVHPVDAGLKAEVIDYSALLSRWGIGLTELASASPKNEDLKNDYQKIARMIAGDEILLNGLMEKKRLPIKEIEKEVQIHRKKVERGRIYIIAMVLAIVSGFSYMDIGRGGE